MARFETNAEQVKKSVEREHKQQQQRARYVTGLIGRELRDNIRANIAPPIFPGYAMTGALARKVVRGKVITTNTGFETTVRVQQTGKQKKYAQIHEKGGVITAKNAPYLVFNVRGRWIRTKQVRIRGKRYYEKGVIKTVQQWGNNRLAREFGVRNFSVTID